MISFRKEETPISSKIYAWSSEEKINNRNIICEYSVGKYIKQEIEELQQEIERLNNIINELEKWLNEVIDDEDITRMELAVCQTILRKLKELKGK